MCSAFDRGRYLILAFSSAAFQYFSRLFDLLQILPVGVKKLLITCCYFDLHYFGGMVTSLNKAYLKEDIFSIYFVNIMAIKSSNTRFF
jgi:hypothetical protein